MALSRIIEAPKTSKKANESLLTSYTNQEAELRKMTTISLAIAQTSDNVLGYTDALDAENVKS